MARVRAQDWPYMEEPFKKLTLKELSKLSDEERRDYFVRLYADIQTRARRVRVRVDRAKRELDRAQPIPDQQQDGSTQKEPEPRRP